MDLPDHRPAFCLLCAAGLWWGESVSTRRGDDLDVSQVPGAPLEPADSVLTPQLLILHTAPHRETGQRGGGVDAMLFPSPAAGLTPAGAQVYEEGLRRVSLVTEVRSRPPGSGGLKDPHSGIGCTA